MINNISIIFILKLRLYNTYNKYPINTGIICKFNKENRPKKNIVGGINIL